MPRGTPPSWEVQPGREGGAGQGNPENQETESSDGCLSALVGTHRGVQQPHGKIGTEFLQDLPGLLVTDEGAYVIVALGDRPGGLAPLVQRNSQRNDLLSIAQAERAYRALNGRYASLEELRSSGDLLIDPARGRQGYVYSAEISNDHFTITATYTGPATGMPTLSLDESMEITQR